MVHSLEYRVVLDRYCRIDMIYFIGENWAGCDGTEITRTDAPLEFWQFEDGGGPIVTTIDWDLNLFQLVTWDLIPVPDTVSHQSPNMTRGSKHATTLLLPGCIKLFGSQINWTIFSIDPPPPLLLLPRSLQSHFRNKLTTINHTNYRGSAVEMFEI